MPFKDKEKAEQYAKQWRLNNKEKIKDDNKIWRKNNYKEYFAKNKNKINEYQKLWHRTNAEKFKLPKHLWYLKNRQRIITQKAKYRFENKDKIKQFQNTEHYKNYRRNYYQKYNSVPLQKVNLNMKRRLSYCLANINSPKNYRSTVNLLGYDKHQLKTHVEKQFDSKMNWNNYGKYWDLDHKVPVTFAKNEKDLTKLFQLGNLQPLPKITNIKKSNRVIADLFNSDFGGRT